MTNLEKPHRTSQRTPDSYLIEPRSSQRPQVIRAKLHHADLQWTMILPTLVGRGRSESVLQMRLAVGRAAYLMVSQVL
jgi:hypothetical protein